MSRKFVTSLFLVVILSLALTPIAMAAQVFSDDFDGNAIDTVKWNTSIATSGKRWCSTTVEYHHSNPGTWLDISKEACHGLTQASPYGKIVVSGGQAGFSANKIRAFPYVWSGPPSRQSPFPSTGDFILELKMKYDNLQPQGNGFSVFFWENSDPIGNNPPAPFGQGFLNIWADSGDRSPRISAMGTTIPMVNPLVYHDYRLEYINGKYSLFVDGTLRVGPVASSRRPNTIWIGNPVFNYWESSPGDWTDFSIDFVRVTVPDIEVAADIKPQESPNYTNVRSKMLPVAILGTTSFDVTKIDPTSIRLEGLAPLSSHLEDVGTPSDPLATGDGIIDLALRFDNQKIISSLGEISDGDVHLLELTGNLKKEFGGTPILGKDAVIIIKKGNFPGKR